jgi:hypothetical protein
MAEAVEADMVSLVLPLEAPVVIDATCVVRRRADRTNIIALVDISSPKIQNILIGELR